MPSSRLAYGLGNGACGRRTFVGAFFKAVRMQTYEWVFFRRSSTTVTPIAPAPKTAARAIQRPRWGLVSAFPAAEPSVAKPASVEVDVLSVPVVSVVGWAAALSEGVEVETVEVCSLVFVVVAAAEPFTVTVTGWVYRV